MRGWRIALLAVLLAACSDEPRRAPSSPIEPAHSDYAALVNWFAERGITLPDAPPSPDGPAAKAAQDGRLLGDASGNGSVSFYDLWVLFQYLSGEVYFAQHFDMDALDIDRDGDNDWIDLALLGDFLFGSGENPHGIGQAMEARLPDPALGHGVLRRRRSLEEVHSSGRRGRLLRSGGGERPQPGHRLP